MQLLVDNNIDVIRANIIPLKQNHTSAYIILSYNVQIIYIIRTRPPLGFVGRLIIRLNG